MVLLIRPLVSPVLAVGMAVGMAVVLGLTGLAEASPGSSPPPGQVVYVATTSEAGTSRARLFTSRTDGTGLLSVYSTQGYAVWLAAPRWSPDGTRIALGLGGAAPGIEYQGVLVVDADDPDSYAWINEGAGEAPKWSPDGQWLAYQDVGDESGVPGCCRFWVRIVRVDGSGIPGARKLAFGGSEEFLDFVAEGTGWAWSPDSKRIAYVYPARSLGRERDGTRRLAVGMVDVATGKKRFLAAGTHPAWSPDGRWLVLGMGDTSSREPASFNSSSYPGPEGCGGLWLVAANGGKRRPLVPRISNVCDTDPSWSPDGRWIAFTRHRGDHTTYLVVTPDAKTLTRAIPASAASVRWPTDCSRLFFYKDGWIVPGANGTPNFVPLLNQVKGDWRC